MADRPISLDSHRGLAAQKATELRRLLSGVQEDAKALKARQEELEANLKSVPSESWQDVAEKARYLILLFAETTEARDPRRRKLIDTVLREFRKFGLPD